jgi:hypothetical protein
VRDFCVTAWGHDHAQRRVALLADLVGRFDEPCDVRRAVVGHDPVRLVPQQILPILQAHTGGAKAMAERVLEIVDAVPLEAVRARAPKLNRWALGIRRRVLSL